MCEHCTPFTVKDFSSQQDFRSFKNTLDAACIDETFIRVINADETARFNNRETYQCTFCETDWTLFIDTRSWHGSFLPAQGVTVFEDNETYEESDTTFKTFQGKSNKNCGCCLLMFLLFLGLIVYGLYSLVSFLLDLLF